jgi:integrase
VSIGKTGSGKQRRSEVGLGGYPAVTLQQARDKAREVREKIVEGIDPIAERKAARSALLASRATEITFEAAAQQYIAAKSPEWKNAKHVQQWTNTLTTYAFPFIGKLHVRDINTPHVVEVLKPIWEVKTETATRLRGRIEAILDWATVHKYRDGTNPARWKGHLQMILATPSKVAEEDNHPALPFADAPAFMQHLRKMEGTGARAVEFGILTATRSQEIRGARWSEIDLDARLWKIPADRMKMRKAHEVPLSDDAIALLKALPKFEGNDLVFPASRGGELSDMTLTAALRRMHESETKAGRKGYVDPNQLDAEGTPRRITMHGFRSTFRDWCAEHTEYPREVAEMALAHSIDSKVEAAYRRGNLLQKRQSLMADWAAYCTQGGDYTFSVSD